MTERPSHHGPDGRFLNPWPGEAAGKKPFREVLRWRMQRWRDGVAPTPPLRDFPRGQTDIVRSLPRGERARVTWIGHSSFLVQLQSHNILTDPVWSDVVSPLPRMGPRRITPPGVAFDDLPDIHTVLISHDHYDHLDEPTVRRLHARFGDSITWVTPLRYAEWLARRGIRNVVELDWWQQGNAGSGDAQLRIRALPARHWTQRSARDAFHRLWCSFSVEHADGTRVYFGGDSGYGSFYAEIGEREKPHDVVMLPIGAYDPRWFMKAAHMNPEDAVQAYKDLGGSGVFVPMHWGTFRLADDPPLEAPERLRAAWFDAGLPPGDLAVAAHGHTTKVL